MQILYFKENRKTRRENRCRGSVSFIFNNFSHRHTCTHLLKHIVKLLQGWSHSPVTTHTACIAIEVNVGHSVQSVMTKGTDHRGPDRSVLPIREVGLLIDRRFIQSGIISGVNMLPSVRLKPLHQEC